LDSIEALLSCGQVWTVILQNLAVDSIRDFLCSYRGGPGLRLTWDSSKEWCAYVYEHTSELSGLRTLMSKYLYYALMFSSRLNTKKDRQTLEYSVETMYFFASEILDLMRVLYFHIRNNNLLQKTSLLTIF
jgi:hypothetical protein